MEIVIDELLIIEKLPDNTLRVRIKYSNNTEDIVVMDVLEYIDLYNASTFYLKSIQGKLRIR